jgi:hypothetical protein
LVPQLELDLLVPQLEHIRGNMQGGDGDLQPRSQHGLASLLDRPYRSKAREKMEEVTAPRKV